MEQSNAAEQLRDSLAKPEKPSLTLWEIGADMIAVGEKIAENAGELTPEIEAELDAIGGAFDDRAERVYLFAKDSALNAEKAKAMKDHYAQMERYWLNKERGLKRYLLNVMERVGKDRVQTYKAKFSRILGPVKYRWAGDTYEAIPARFREQNPVVYTLDLQAVKDAVANGETLPPEITQERDWFIR